MEADRTLAGVDDLAAAGCFLRTRFDVDPGPDVALRSGLGTNLQEVLVPPEFAAIFGDLIEPDEFSGGARGN
jgi:hypothetical protein